MNIRVSIILLILIVSLTDSLNAQELKSELDEVYNMNPELYNGSIFTGVYRGRVDGTQFLLSKDFFTGDIGLKVNTFKQQQLNYDVYEQKVLLSFKDDIEAIKIIEVPLANLNFFYLDNKYFEVQEWEGNSYRIFQVFGDDSLKILIHWTKTLNAGTGSQNNRSKFSNLKKRLWLYIDGDYHPIKNNKTLISHLSPDQQALVKEWLKKNKIKIQKADDEEFQMIIDYLAIQ